ncbi:hypothetical protein [Microtetraspora sp. NBRC 16547]|uniref:hypothetical protein n=1 Tax=Microtetraspora sp. NBRC 16547 TaxID=3030993 RepID=UPI0024A02BEF|nr:hypothetical protein [Microtetraspora sp. NBRC 16547]GLW98482.1 hypothetical protein Misp02_25690 [Microtetraspora sp. NBRC 16547]
MIFISASRNLRRAATLLCVVAAIGCSASGAGDLPVPRVASDLVLPLDAYHLAPEDQARVQRARFMLVKDCMRRFRVDFQGPSPGRTRGSAPPSTRGAHA